MKLRPSQSFRDAIAQVRATFGLEDNDIKDIVKRALISFKKKPFAYSKPHDKGAGNPITINTNFRTETMREFESSLKPKDIQGIVIAFCNTQIENSKTRQYAPLVLDKCDNFKIEDN